MLISVHMKPYSEFRFIEEWVYAYTHNRETLVPFCKERGITMEELGARITKAGEKFFKFVGSLINK